jgi:hypothetical protein
MPLPKPSARKCAGWLSAKRRFGRATILTEVIKALAEVIKALVRERKNPSRRVEHCDTGAGLHAADGRERQPQAPRQLDDLCVPRRGR